ncbi:DUF4291 family protein [Streptomyces iconiensis]|uniref:DUF4291 family protein n=1 Tax=Streptomyces iconiensis TaxID=1384038 RepID=UPI003D2F66BA
MCTSLRTGIDRSGLGLHSQPLNFSSGLAPLASRAIQIGLSRGAVDLYADRWITDITDITDLVREIHSDVRAGKPDVAMGKLPPERVYPLSEHIRQRIGADQNSTQ